ncbi:hypothetical protein TNCV_1001071 [Trichonephila clavipes]|nr:hypothetical protein TNCV_1001071 [Trichonephila clavipes]
MLDDKLKEKDKKKKPEASKQKNIQSHLVKKSGRASKLQNDSNISSKESFDSEKSSVMDFFPSTKELGHENTECICYNGKCSED